MNYYIYCPEDQEIIYSGTQSECIDFVRNNKEDYLNGKIEMRSFRYTVNVTVDEVYPVSFLCIEDFSK